MATKTNDQIVNVPVTIMQAAALACLHNALLETGILVGYFPDDMHEIREFFISMRDEIVKLCDEDDANG